MTGTDPPPTDRRRDDDATADAMDPDDPAANGTTADDDTKDDGARGDDVEADDTKDDDARGDGSPADDDRPTDPGAGDDGDRTATGDASARPVPEAVRVEGDGPPSEAVLRAVQTAAGIDLAESDERLVDVVDADALDDLFDSAAPDGRVEFAFCGCRVTVESDGRVRVTPDDAG